MPIRNESNLSAKDVTTWREACRGNFLSFDDIESDTVVTIEKVTSAEVQNLKDYSWEEKTLVYFLEFPETPIILNATNAKTLKGLFGAGKPLKESVGKQITIWPDASVKVAGKAVGGLRIRNALPVSTKELPTIDPERFVKLVKSIQDGKFTKEKAYAKFTFTAEQEAELLKL